MARVPNSPNVKDPVWFGPLVAFQLLYGLATAIFTVLVWSNRLPPFTGTLRLAAAVVGAIVTIMSAFATAWTWRRRHRGRLISFLLDYLLAIVAAFVALQAVNFFNGLDALGETFSRGAPFLVLIGAGALLNRTARRFPVYEQGLRQAARVTMLVGGLIVLLRVGTPAGLLTFLTRMIQPQALIPLLVAALAATAAVVLWRDGANQVFGSSRDQIEVMNGFFFVSPNLIGFLAFFAGPLVFSLFVTFTDWDGINQASWVGLDNYAHILSLQARSLPEGAATSSALDPGFVSLFQVGSTVFGARDPLFWTGLRNVLIFGLVAVPLATIPALLIAALLNNKLPFIKVFRAIYFLPSIAGVVGVALIWKQLFSATIGFVNYSILRFFDVLNLIPGVELTAPQPEWLASPRTALLAVIVVFAWSVMGFNTVLFLAGMQGIPGSLYEAADLDGAGPWARFRRITVPMLAPTTTFVVTTTTILALQLFNEPFILNVPNPANGPSNSTLTPVIHLFRNAFEEFELGYSSAVAWILFLLIFLITLLYFRRRSDEAVTA